MISESDFRISESDFRISESDLGLGSASEFKTVDCD